MIEHIIALNQFRQTADDGERRGDDPWIECTGDLTRKQRLPLEMRKPWKNPLVESPKHIENHVFKGIILVPLVSCRLEKQ